MLISGINPIRGGRQVVCLPGSTLFQLEDMLSAIGREPPAQRPFRVTSQRRDMLLPDHVGRRLAKIVDVAIDLLDDIAR